MNRITTFDSLNLTASYAPNPGFIGLDSFSYSFCYGVQPVGNLCDSALVYITVEPRLEDCFNSLDDDGDGLIDCDDPNCLPSKPTIFRKKR